MKENKSKHRVTTVFSDKHKRFIEDYAHEKRISQYEALSEMIEEFYNKYLDERVYIHDD